MTVEIVTSLTGPLRRTPARGRRLDPLDVGTALLRLLPPNVAHRLAIEALKRRLVPPDRRSDDPVLSTRLWDLDFANPLGLAAGFDKDAEAVDALIGLGFGFVEAGTVTPLPQPGNRRPNLFRLPEDRAVINRMGFPSRGVERFAANLAHRRRPGIVGANVGRNRETTDEGGDFARCVAAVAGLADYLVVNISSPNTPGLRELQHGERLVRLLDCVTAARDRAVGGRKPPLLVKVAPDLDDAAMASIAEAACAAGIDGLIVANTTVARPNALRSANARQAGGLSGPMLFDPSTRALAAMWRFTEGRIPLIGCGGVASGADAYAKIRAGASLVQVYTALVYAGPGLVGRIKRELAGLLKAHGFPSVSAAVGADVR
jgi:dihydroorotate dehydrogenase